MVVRDTIRNPLVLRMTDAERASLGLERIELRKRDVLGRVDELQRHYVFIESGMVSIVRTMSDDRSCKTGHVAFPGMVGISSFFLTELATADYVVALAGQGLRVERERLRCVVNRNPDLTALFKQLAHVAWVMNGLTSGCNRLHEFEPRLCRWLLLASTAIDAAELPLSQTEVARLLGGSRQQMRLVVRKLRADGLLQTAPGRIRLVDKAGLETNACECYGAMVRRFAEISNAKNKNEFSVYGATHLSRTTRQPGVTLETEN